jgi:hypothetical protein
MKVKEGIYLHAYKKSPEFFFRRCQNESKNQEIVTKCQNTKKQSLRRNPRDCVTYSES